ncbi:hypothetical protein [Nocardiopsis sp. NRRL B-16309]|uniref:hypothetical protein n=1 Tax=Nocardiopsis sp. NRRL B-16309 TaxID=1519494 RepID=UPI0006ADD4F6|nr:hypothetical protein [Nocardiopsis sp. NRRL B-16309]KOX12480.1 hypothetical protein ADL05_21645 [Nocardiopsis sp. NRRL B-16309]
MKTRTQYSALLSSLLLITACSDEPSPQQASWEIIQEAPIQGREGHSVVWTGDEVIVWGGRAGDELADGAAYDPHADTWRTIATPSGFTSRYGHTAVWTGEEMLVTQGRNAAGAESDGMLYSPDSDTWRAAAAAPDITDTVDHFAFDGGAVVLSEDAVHQYDADADDWSWTETGFPVVDGALMASGQVAFVGIDEGRSLSFGAADPVSGEYQRLPSQGIQEGPWDRAALVASEQNELWLVSARSESDRTYLHSLREGDEAWTLEYEDESQYLQASEGLGNPADTVLLIWDQGDLVSVRAGAIGIFDTETSTLSTYQADNDVAPCLLGGYTVLADTQLVSWSGPSCRSDAPLSYPAEGLSVELPN